MLFRQMHELKIEIIH